MFEATYIKDLNQQYTGVCVRPSTIKSITNDVIDFFRQFDRYSHLTYAELYQMISPSVRNEQFKVFQTNGEIWGFTNWAFVNDAVLDKYLSTGRLGTLDWNSGLKMCYMETVSRRDMNKMISWMKNYSVNLLGENVRLYWMRSADNKIRSKMKIRTKRNWRWADL